MTQQADYVSTVVPEPLTGLDLDMLAEDLASAISDNGHAERGLDVTGEAIRLALPAFIAACLARQAELDDTP